MNSNSMRNLIIFLFLAAPFTVLSNFDIIDNIGNAIKSGSSKEVAKFFDSSVEITIQDKESVYSKVQAEMVLKDFFSKNSVQSFEINHRGSSGQGSTYGIGTMKSSSQSFRVYYLVRQKGGSNYIQEMRFEKQR